MTTRIRWEPVRRQNHNALVGHVGTAEKFRFRIWRSPWAIGGWQLGLALPGGGLIYIADGSDPDKLKPAAEAWFGEFIVSLGAVFPEGECPECGFRPPTHTHDKECSRFVLGVTRISPPEDGD